MTAIGMPSRPRSRCLSEGAQRLYLIIRRSRTCVDVVRRFVARFPQPDFAFRWLTSTGRAFIRPYAERRIMPSVAGERQRGGHRILGVLGIIRGPTRTPEGHHLA